WLYVYLFIEGFLKKDFQYIAYAFFPLALLTTVRLEAVLYIIVYFLLVFYFVLRRKFEINIRNRIKYLVPFLLGFLIIGNVFIFDPSLFSVIIGNIKAATVGTSLAWGPPENIPYNQQLFVWTTLFFMFTPAFLLIIFLGILNFFKESMETKKILLLIAVLILPQFALLIRPGIAFYLPWAMRIFWAV
ncbi:unnamed protein product, partial [marine sediment metagenome]